MNTLSGALATTNSNLTTTNNTVTSLSGNLNTTNNNLSTLSGNLNTTNNNLATTSGYLATATGDILSLSGVVATKISLTSLSGSNGVGYNNTTGQFTDLFTFNGGLSRVGNTIGLISGIDGQILTLSGGTPAWVNPASVSVPVDTVFGRTGDILAMTGDYISDQITE